MNWGDFRPLHLELITPGGNGHFGLVFVPRTYHLTTGDAGRLINALEEKLAQYPDEHDLASGETWIQAHAARRWTP